jgi:outer membrane immunogenic protein
MAGVLNMKIMKRSLLSAVAVLALSSMAHAADVAPPVSNWTGVYVGIGVGGNYTFGDLNAAGYGYVSDYVSEDDAYGDFRECFASEDCGEFSFTYGDYGSSSGYIPLEVFDNDSNHVDFRGGAVAGLGGAQTLSDVLNNILDSGGDLSDLNGLSGADTGKAGFFGRGEIGADYQIDSIVIGINAGFDFGKRNLKASGGGAGLGDLDIVDNGSGDALIGMAGYGAGSVRTDLQLEESWSLGARLGWLATDRTLLFLSGGYVTTKADLSARFDGTFGAGAGNEQTGGGFDANLGISASNSDWLNGFYIGGGIETLLTDNIGLKLEYRYKDLGSISTSAEAGDGWTNYDTDYGYGVGVRASSDVTEHAVFTTLSWRFGL